MNESAALRERLEEINASLHPQHFSYTWDLVFFMVVMLVGFALVGSTLIDYFHEEGMTRWAFRMLEERQLMECIRKKPWDIGATSKIPSPTRALFAVPLRFSVDKTTVGLVLRHCFNSLAQCLLLPLRRS